jgi:diacylglycerol kinase family enzyme
VFTKTSYTTPQNLKNALGHMAYILEGIQELGQLRTHYVRMETENRVEEGQYLFGAICNSTSLGGILKLDPSQVDMCDGLFEVMLISKPKNIAEVTECIQALRRQQYNCKMMTFFSASKLKITAEPDMCWTLDGERESGHKEILVENIHKGYRLVKKYD